MALTVQDRFKSLKTDIGRLSAYRDILRSQAQALEADEIRHKYTSDLHQKCSEVFKSWLEDSMRKNVDSMAQLASTGLKHIIHDQNLQFSIKQEPKYNRLAMKFVLEEDGHEGDPIASYGGGAAVIISFILRIAVMTRMKMANLLILDESLASLANAYVPSAAEFMHQLSEETGINILMVTHNDEFLKNAHVAYEGYKENQVLSLRQIRGPSAGKSD